MKGVNSEAATRGLLYKKAFLKNFAIFTGKQLCWGLCLKAYNFMTKRPQHRCFPVNIVNFEEQLLRRTSANGCFYKLFQKLINKNGDYSIL